jgi:hypothetical protein
MKDAIRDLLSCHYGICQVLDNESCLWFRPLKTGHSLGPSHDLSNGHGRHSPHAVSSSFAQSCDDLT